MNHSRVRPLEIEVSPTGRKDRVNVNLSGQDLPHPYGTFNLFIPFEIVDGFYHPVLGRAKGANGERYEKALPIGVQREALTGILNSDYVRILVDLCLREGKSKKGCINASGLVGGKPTSVGASMDRIHHVNWENKGYLGHY